jgi:YD repeat-containing protein
MRITNILMLFTLMLLGYNMCAQEAPSNPTASSMVSAVGYPVEYSTGMASISVPLYSMPTRSKSVSVDLQLSYHASGVAVDNKGGACGRGWSLSGGGVIQCMKPQGFMSIKDPNLPTSTTSKSTWLFNFNGMSGKLVLIKGFNSLSIDNVYESNGRRLRGEVFYTQDANSFDLIGFVIRDDEGMQYEFMPHDVDMGIFGMQEQIAVDSYINQLDIAPPGPYGTVPSNYVQYRAKTAFHLTGIKDMHDMPLVDFVYKEFKTPDDLNSSELDYSYILHSIISKGFGRIDMGIYNTRIEDCLYHGMNIYDDPFLYSAAPKIKEFAFEYAHGSYGTTGEDKLTAVREFDTGGNEGQVYKFEYKMMITYLGARTTKDKWGYPNGISNNCNNIGAADEYSTNGVLQKMILPTGGCVVYDFEPSTFSYDYSRPLEVSPIPDTIENNFYTDTEFFYRYAHFGVSNSPRRDNYHNYDIKEVKTLSFSKTHTEETFDIDNTDGYKFFVKAGGSPYTLLHDLTEIPQPNTPIFHPSFQLQKMGDPLPEIIADYDYFSDFINDLVNYNHYNWDDSGLCLGPEITAGTGSYKMTMSFNSDTHNEVTGGAKIYKFVRKPLNEYKKWWYGGGIRIKSVSYFTQDVEAMAYLTEPTNFSPVRKITYGYNFFDEPNRSSGVLMATVNFYDKDTNIDIFHKVIDGPLVFYTNVSVSDTSLGGKTDYVYYTPVTASCGYDDLGAIHCEDFRFGEVMEKKIYSNEGKLLQQVDYEYYVSTNLPEEFSLSPLRAGWCDLKKQVTKNYGSSNSPSDVSETVEEYKYLENSRKLGSQTSSSAIAGEFLEIKYTYIDALPSGELSVLLPKSVESYRNGEFISRSNTDYYTKIINYGAQFDLETKFLPQLMQSSKGENPLETKMKINKYDDYSHVLETEVVNGLKTSYIWGYNNTQIIAKVENMAYDDIPATLITAAQSASDVIGTGYNEVNVITALNNLRNASQLSQAFVTAYTYKPLTGLSTVIDARGKKQVYEYDTFGRLERVRDNENNILSENKYHIKQQ